MKRIYFVRHVEGQDNVARKFSSTWTDHHLSGDTLTTAPAIPPLSSIQEK
jgi:broad specificity phosphatase PhoE